MPERHIEPTVRIPVGLRCALLSLWLPGGKVSKPRPVDVLSRCEWHNHQLR